MVVRLPGASAVALLALGFMLPGQETARVAPRFVPGERRRYTMEMKVETRTQVAALAEGWSQPDRATRLEVNLTWTVETLAVEPDGSAHLRSQIEHFTAAPVSTLLAAENYEGKAISYTRRPDGSIEDIQAPAEWLTDGKLPGWLRAWLTQATDGLGLALSERQPGDQWAAERMIRTPGLPALRLKRESTYLRNETHRPLPCAAVLTRFSLESADGQEQTLEEQPRVVTRVRGSGESLNCYHLVTGRLLESTHTSREDILIQMERRVEGGAPTRVALRAQTTVESFLRLVE